MLYQIVHDYKSKLWCGLAAGAALTGYPTSTVAQLAKQFRPDQKIGGMYDSTLWYALRQLGLRIDTQFTGESGLTLAQFAKKYKQLFAEHPMLVVVGNHFIVLHKNVIVDNHHPDPVLIRDCVHLRKRVHRGTCWKPSGDKPALPILAPKPRPKFTMAKLKARAAAVGVEIDPGDHKGEWWVQPLTDMEDDPCEGSHFCVDLDDVDQCLTSYEEHAAKASS